MSDPSQARRWTMLAISLLAQISSAVVTNGIAFLIPALQHERGLSLAGAGAVAAASTVGVMVTLIAWGYLVDRIGERVVLVVGLVGASLFAGLAAAAHTTVLMALALFAAGAFAASTNAASGRIVVGWFPPHRRGLTMGIRQMAQPLGVGLAALTMPVIARSYDVRTALVVPTVATAIAAVLVALVVLDPPRGERTAVASRNPYRAGSFLWRIHGVSVLLVVPQFVVWTFALAWLIADRHWSPGAAGGVVALSQIFGAFGRIGVGALSDRLGSRMKPLAAVAIAAMFTMLALGFAAGAGSPLAVVLLVVATTVTVADNGLAFTSVAEYAGPFWSGRALGVQNTAQFLTAAAVPPIAGAAITVWSYSGVFAAAALFPAIAIGLVPVRGEHPD